ncbi:MAG: DEAD/DEAH box helicase family protein [Lachnospiraceae bacterium]|nr:DEAD/DEAH box helicase family protein [Lachnospiraceae bacterium]
MNIEAYNLDSLRKLIRDLQKENTALKEILSENCIPYESTDAFQCISQAPDEYDPDQASLIETFSVTDDIANRFFSLFWGRTDVFARRGKKGGYFPQCQNRWDSDKCPKQKGQTKFSCNSCAFQEYEKLGLQHIKQHLIGARENCTDVIGVYPLLPDNTCRFLVFDFDNHEKGSDQQDNANTDETWREEVDALRKICKLNGVDALTERSRSGRGAHVWIFFRQPIPAYIARQFGFSLLDKGCESINLTSFRFYDRMYPSQDRSDQIGNLVALPLQGGALRSGNSAFVDESWNAYPDQLEVLWNTGRLSLEDVEKRLVQWEAERTGRIVNLSYLQGKERLKPWKRNDSFHTSDVTGVFHIVLADGIYVDTLNLSPRIQNQIRCLATIDNPEFYRRKKSGNSTYYYLSTIYLGKDIDGYIQLPRGLYEVLLDKCTEAGIIYDVEDNRTTGKPIRVSFRGELRTQQDLAAEKLLRFENGILSAATAFGKTVVCSYLIAERKLSTLVLLESADLVEQWIDELNRFLVIDEEPPVYLTKTGRKKNRKSVIGTFQAGTDKTTGIVDVAMIGSVYGRGEIFPGIDRYGLVIMDECHHAASTQAQQVLRRVKAKYVYGVSATPVRSDKLEKINYMMLGPIRHQYTAKEHALRQGMELFVRPRFTRVVDFSGEKLEIHRAYELISESADRNEQIIIDVQESLRDGRTPVILTRLKKHAKLLYDRLSTAAQHVFLLYGDNTQNRNQEIRREMLHVPDNESMLLIATGQKIGEGFDCPRLDTLMLASPVKFDGRLIQYVGRLNRNYAGKQNVVVYDYVDTHIAIFDNQYRNRLAAYKKIGYQIQSGSDVTHQLVNSIYDRGNYAEVFERDMVEAETEIVIASPNIRRRKIERMLSLLKTRQEAGVKVTVITLDPNCARFGDPGDIQELIAKMQRAGITVVVNESENEHYAVIDKKLVWHGGMNLLGREDVWDNLIRVENVQAAAELLEMSRQSILNETESAKSARL